jgi:Tol biopolymer transport system component
MASFVRCAKFLPLVIRVQGRRLSNPEDGLHEERNMNPKRIPFVAAFVSPALLVAAAILWKGAAPVHAAQNGLGHLTLVFTSSRDASCPNPLPDGQCESDEFGDLYVNAPAIAPTPSAQGSSRITFDENGSFGAVWSPDGKTIAYQGPSMGRPQIFLIDPNGFGKTQLTGTDVSNDTGSGAQFPDWSPDGKTIVFHTPLAPGITYRDIFVINADGSGLQDLTNNKGSVNRDIRAAWSPDGSRIAFNSNRLSNDGCPNNRNDNLWVMNADGTNLIQLTHSCEPDQAPDWSPDGSRIVFHRGTLLTHAEIWVLNLEDGTETQLTDTPDCENSVVHRNLDPAWSPDGSRIAFDSDRDNCLNTRQVWVMDAAPTNLGLHQQQLTFVGENGHAGWGWGVGANKASAIAQHRRLIPATLFSTAVSRTPFALSITEPPMPTQPNIRLRK